MAWNRPSDEVSKQQVNRHSGLSKGLAAGAILVACASGFLYLICNLTDPGIKDDRIAPRQFIVEPTNIAKAATVTVVTNTLPKSKKLKTYIDEKGVERYEGGLRVVKHWPKPPEEQMDTNNHLFENVAEFQIHGLITIEPGRPILDVKYNPRVFERAFRESLNHKIEILPDDSPEVAEEKQAVIEAKQTLRDALERGENITEIMNQTKAEFVRLNRYRDQLKSTAAEALAKGSATDKEINEYLEAMNCMLKENGIREIRQKDLVRDILRHQHRAAHENSKKGE